jgi:hypothetical protein
MDAMSPTEAIKRAVTLALQVELPTVSVWASNHDPSMGEESQKASSDTAVGEDARSLDR